MPKLLQINVTANWGSTGRIAEECNKIAQSKGWKTYVAYGVITTFLNQKSIV